jgi:hypothetical protein
VFNSEATAVKFLQSIYTNSTTEPDEVVTTTPYGAGQRTTLIKEDFIYRENQYFSEVLRNELTPGVANPVLDGDVMRGEYFLVEIRFSHERKFKLFAVTLRHVKSELTAR